MGLQFISQVEKKIGTIDAKLIEEDAQKLKAIKEQQQIAFVPDTKKYNHMKVGISSTGPCL